MAATREPSGPALTIGYVAEAARVSASAIRYYERKGLLPAAERSAGRRRYSEGIIQLLRVMEVAKASGFSLLEIKQLLRGFDGEVPPSERWRRLTAGKLNEIDRLIARAEGMRALLRRGLECGCLTLDDCGLIQ